jgi:hypothetical protein
VVDTSVHISWNIHYILLIYMVSLATVKRRIKGIEPQNPTPCLIPFSFYSHHIGMRPVPLFRLYGVVFLPLFIRYLFGVPLFLTSVSPVQQMGAVFPLFSTVRTILLCRTRWGILLSAYRANPTTNKSARWRLEKLEHYPKSPDSRWKERGGVPCRRSLSSGPYIG